MATHEHGGVLRDEVLLGHVCDGCADCFAALFHRYFRQVFTVAFRILRGRTEAQDMLQEVFLAIFRYHNMPPAEMSARLPAHFRQGRGRTWGY